MFIALKAVLIESIGNANMHVVDKVGQLLSMSSFPDEVWVVDGWEVVLLPSEYDPVNNCDYLPKELIAMLNESYEKSVVNLGAGEFGPNGELLAQAESFTASYSPTLFDDFYHKVGCPLFTAEFVMDGSFLIGFEKEYVLFVSCTESDFIAMRGGQQSFKTLNEKIYMRGRSAMPREAFRKSSQAVYGK